MLVVPREVSGVPMAATRALIRRGVKRLHLVALPTSSLQADLLIGAGCVDDAGDQRGQPRRIRPGAALHRRRTSGAIEMKDATCPALHAALQAAEKGVPFMPLRGLIGSDVLKYRDDWKVIDSPFGNDDPIVLLPAIKPDVALIHAPMADRFGNVWIGRQRELATMAHAAEKTDRDRRENPRRQSARRSGARRRHAAGLLCRERRGGRARRLAAAAARIITRPMRSISPTRAWPQRGRLRRLSRQVCV